MTFQPHPFAGRDELVIAIAIRTALLMGNLTEKESEARSYQMLVVDGGKCGKQDIDIPGVRDSSTSAWRAYSGRKKRSWSGVFVRRKLKKKSHW